MDDLVARILEEGAFLELETDVHRASHALTAAVSNRLQAFAAGISLGVDYALALRGSHARGFSDPYSDVDVVLLADPDFEQNAELLRSLLQSIDPALYSLHFYPTRINPSQVSLSQWLALPHLSYVTGNYASFHSYKGLACNGLRTRTLDDLLALFEKDPARGNDWQRRRSHQFAHFKRGMGALVEVEFCHLLNLWVKLTGTCSADEISRHSSQAELYARYIGTMKPALRRIANSPVETFRITPLFSEATFANLPWFFQEDIIEEVVVAHHGCLLDFMSQLKENSRDAPAPACVSELCAFQR